jgi:hypothetical protein
MSNPPGSDTSAQIFGILGDGSSTRASSFRILRRRNILAGTVEGTMATETRDHPSKEGIPNKEVDDDRATRGHDDSQTAERRIKG